MPRTRALSDPSATPLSHVSRTGQTSGVDDKKTATASAPQRNRVLHEGRANPCTRFAAEIYGFGLALLGWDRPRPENKAGPTVQEPESKRLPQVARASEQPAPLLGIPTRGRLILEATPLPPVLVKEVMEFLTINAGPLSGAVIDRASLPGLSPVFSVSIGNFYLIGTGQNAERLCLVQAAAVHDNVNYEFFSNANLHQLGWQAGELQGFPGTVHGVDIFHFQDFPALQRADGVALFTHSSLPAPASFLKYKAPGIDPQSGTKYTYNVFTGGLLKLDELQRLQQGESVYCWEKTGGEIHIWAAHFLEASPTKDGTVRVLLGRDDVGKPESGELSPMTDFEKQIYLPQSLPTEQRSGPWSKWAIVVSEAFPPKEGDACLVRRPLHGSGRWYGGDSAESASESKQAGPKASFTDSTLSVAYRRDDEPMMPTYEDLRKVKPGDEYIVQIQGQDRPQRLECHSVDRSAKPALLRFFVTEGLERNILTVPYSATKLPIMWSIQKEKGLDDDTGDTMQLPAAGTRLTRKTDFSTMPQDTDLLVGQAGRVRFRNYVEEQGYEAIRVSGVPDMKHINADRIEADNLDPDMCLYTINLGRNDVRMPGGTTPATAQPQPVIEQPVETKRAQTGRAIAAPEIYDLRRGQALMVDRLVGGLTKPWPARFVSADRHLQTMNIHYLDSLTETTPHTLDATHLPHVWVVE